MGVPQHVIVLMCKRHYIFNLYAEYIMRKAGLDSEEGRVKVCETNISRLRFIDDMISLGECTNNSKRVNGEG